MSKLIYTGVGSRKTPVEVCELMRRVAVRLSARGYVLRSGAAEGADAAFEAGAQAKEIYLPWRRFNGHDSPLYDVQTMEEARAIASSLHPRWRALPESAKLLHTRNVFQVLGADLATPSDFLLCWTRDGVETEQDRSASTGGTGSAIALASRHGIPVVNMANPGALDRVKHLVEADRIDTRPTASVKDPAMPDPTAFSSNHALTTSVVADILQAHGEICAHEQVCHYSSLAELARRASGSRSWAAGEVFVYAEAEDRFVILKQIAPSGCEMLTITASGIHDVLTAYRFTPQELEAQLSAYLQSPSESLRNRL